MSGVKHTPWTPSEVVAALAEYDARRATCPLNSPHLHIVRASNEVCQVCGATHRQSCGRDNPWPVIEALRSAIARARGEQDGGAS